MKQVFTFLLLCLSFSTYAQLKIMAGTHVVNNGIVVLQEHGIHNNGTFQNNTGTNVVFRGTQNSPIWGSGSSHFYGLELDKTSGNVAVNQNIKVAGPLKFTKGKMDLAYNSVQLIYPNGLVQNETEQNRIFATGSGFIFIEQTLNAPNYVNPGNLGFMIFSTQNLGSTVIYRGHEPQTNAAQQQSMKRYYSVVPANNTNMYLNIRYTYFDAEIDIVTEGSYGLFEKAGAGNWKSISDDGVSVLYNYRESFGLTSLHKYTLFSKATQSPLPLQLIAFNAQCKNNNALLQWITANEVNTKDFVIEKSVDGVLWSPAGTISAQQNTGQHTYTHSVALDNAQFYRLKMRDTDGSFTYSPVKKLNCDTKNVFTVGPNPTPGKLVISATLDKAMPLNISVRDFSGKLILSKTWNAAKGLSTEMIDIYNQPAATYIIAITGDGVNELSKVVKK